MQCMLGSQTSMASYISTFELENSCPIWEHISKKRSGCLRKCKKINYVWFLILVLEWFALIGLPVHQDEVSFVETVLTTFAETNPVYC